MSLIKNTLHAKRRLMGIALLMPLLLGSIPTATANGGTNGLFSRMESYIGALVASGEMSTDEAKAQRETIEALREQVEARLRKNGGWLNTQHDKDIYDEIDRYNRPLYERYTRSRQP